MEQVIPEGKGYGPIVSEQNAKEKMERKKTFIILHMVNIYEFTSNVWW